MFFMQHRVSVIACGLLFLAGCQDYGFVPNQDPHNMHTEFCPLELPSPYLPEEAQNCAQAPEIGSFEPIVEWQWKENPINSSYFRVEVPPLVANLTDDNNDGQIDASDTPDVLFTSFTGSSYLGTGFVVALSGDTGEVLWLGNEYGGNKPYGLGGSAIADVDGDGLPDIFVPADNGVIRLNHLGEFQWLCEVPTRAGGESIISVADLTGDGTGEILVHGAVCTHEGDVLWEVADNASNRYSGSIAVDIDVDGFQEIIAGGTVFNHDGTVRWQHPYAYGLAAVGDLDNDKQPEIILAQRPNLYVLDIHGNLVWEHKFSENGGGAPTVADFDGDGLAEIGIASKAQYYVFEGDGTLLWSRTTQETSSGMTGSAVFDFEGDGAAEVVYADERNLWVFDGLTGEVELQWTEHSSGTRWEFPTIADVDNDGSAEILIGHGRGGTWGLTVLGSKTDQWQPARPIWNQFAYSITNINDDGSLPAFPYPNWWKYNSFRAANAQSKVGLELPDLTIGDPELCAVECYQEHVLLSVPIENRGAQTINQEVQVRFYAVDGDQRRLVHEESLSGMSPQSTRWIGPIQIHVEDFGSEGLVITVDEWQSVESNILECIEDNNFLALPEAPCPLDTGLAE
jgi:hypothetical protein